MVVLLVVVGTGGVAAAESPKDVTPDNPAYKAIQTLIDQGYLGVFQDGSFRGDRPADRYTLATVIARLLSDIQSGKLVLPNEEMKTVRQLATEFRAELVEVAGQATALAQAQEKTAGGLAVVKEDTTRLLGELYQQQQGLAAVQKDLQALQADTTKQGETLKQLQVTAAGGQELANVQKTVNEVLVPQSQALAAKQRALESSLSDLQAEFQSYRRISEQDLATLKTQSRNQLYGGLLAALLLLVVR
jgi:chromosome segregation ATPase